MAAKQDYARPSAHSTADPWIGLLWLVSFALRLWLAPRTLWAEDEKRIYEMAAAYYHGGALPLSGAAVVYSGTSIPGSLLALLAGLPLWLSHGHPVGTAIAVACFNAIGTLMIFWVLARAFKGVPRRMFAAWIFFSPWSLLMSSAVNPHFLLPFSALWLWGMLEQQRRGLAGMAIGFSIACMAQLHLSAAAVALTTLASALLLPKYRLLLQRRPLKGVLAGGTLGALTLIPWLLGQLPGHAHGEEMAKTLGSNIVFHLEPARMIQFWSRLLTFPTADIARFIEAGHGYRGLGVLLSQTPLLWIPALVAMAGSACMVAMALRSYWRLARSSTQGLHAELMQLGLVAVAVTGVMFLFSIKGPSAHTFWIWFPLSFVPVLAGSEGIQWTPSRRRAAWAYLACAAVFTMGVLIHLNATLGVQGLRVMDFGS